MAALDAPLLSSAPTIFIILWGGGGGKSIIIAKSTLKSHKLQHVAIMQGVIHEV